MAISYGRTDIETPIHADMKETLSHGILNKAGQSELYQYIINDPDY